MVIRTEYRGTRYCMGSSDPLPAGFEIRFGGLNFQATGNGYLMRLTNREELRARRQAGPAPVPAARTTTAQTSADTDAAGPSAPRRRRSSGQRSCQARSERRQAERAASQHGAPVSTATTAPVGQRAVSGPRFPIGLRGATTAYNANVNTTMRWVPPGRHVFVAKDPGASAVTNRPWVPLMRCHPPTSTGTRSETSPACRTRSCSGASLTLRTTGSAAPTTPAPGATTLRGNAASSSPTTQQTPPTQRAQATGRSRLPQGSLRAWPQGQAPLLRPTPTRS
jgi:hypothetical protein